MLVDHRCIFFPDTSLRMDVSVGVNVLDVWPHRLLLGYFFCFNGCSI
jgi:hypothetical protein